jgi:HK97 family phage prohead protease
MGRPYATFDATLQLSNTRDIGDNPPKSGTDPGQVPGAGYWAGGYGATDIGDLYFTGLASSTDSPYEMFDAFGPYHEVMRSGAFMSSLALGQQLDVPLVIQHDDVRRLARTSIPAGMPGHLSLSETPQGLMCSAQLDPNDPDVQYIVPKIRSGLMKEMSIRFVISSGEWSPDMSEFVINSADIQRGDVSICGFGANPQTYAAMRNQPMGEAEQRRLYEQLRERFEPKIAPHKSSLFRDSDFR